MTKNRTNGRDGSPRGIPRDAVERMKHRQDIVKLAEELGESRSALYLEAEKRGLSNRSRFCAIRTRKVVEKKRRMAGQDTT